MGQKLLKSTTTFFLILSTISIVIALILDTDDEPLHNGGKYYILPQNIGVGGGLSPKPEPELDCPFYITRDRDETSPGIPVTISSPLRIHFITPGLPIQIVFKDTKPGICMDPLGWKVVLDKTGRQIYVTATGGRVFFAPSETFNIFQEDSKKSEYIIKNVEFENNYVGIFDNNGYLGITDVSVPFKFKKANDNNNGGLAIKVY